MSVSPNTSPKTVVLLQYSGIGDLVWHIPYFKAIAAQSRDQRVTIVAQPSTLARAFLAKEPWVEAIIDHDHRPRRSDRRKGVHAGLRGMWRMAQTLKQGAFDRIVLFSGRPSRGLIAYLSGIPVRLGFGYNWLQRMFLNHPPYISRYVGPSLAVYPEASAFVVAQGFCETAIVPRMAVPADLIDDMKTRFEHLPRPLYMLAVGTSETHKQWGRDNYAELTRQLISRGCGVVLIGGPAEKELAREIDALIPDAMRQAFSVMTDAPVLGSAAALSIADACVGNDTGMVNVAAAVGRPSYVVIGSRPTLDHDPLMHMITAPRLADISVQRVLGMLTGDGHESPAARP